MLAALSFAITICTQDKPRDSELMKETIVFIEKCLKDANELDGYGKTIANVHQWLGDLYIINDNGSSDQQVCIARQHYQTALSTAREAGVSEDNAELHYRLGTLDRDRGNFEEALVHFQSSLHEANEHNDIFSSALASGQLGLLYFRQPEPEATEKAIELIKKAIQLAEELNDDGLLLENYYRLGLCFLFRQHGDESDNLELSVEYSRTALARISDSDDNIRLGAIYRNLGLALRNLGKCNQNDCGTLFRESLDYLKKSQRYLTKKTHPRLWALSEKTIATVYLARGKKEGREYYAQAQKHYEQALEVYLSIDDETWISMLRKSISLIQKLQRLPGSEEGPDVPADS